jgi:glycosyltransferase involved in cell wall biosynthesis
MELPKVSIGFINCNRLHYLKSCVESFMYCTQDYQNKEMIIVDNNSVEEGTEEYLKQKEDQGFKVIRRTHRDPSNEFATALNTVVETSTGDYVAILQGDMQFIVKGSWLQDYVTLIKNNGPQIGCISFDAQRRVTHDSHSFSNAITINDSFNFVADLDRPPLAGAADALYSREVLKNIFPWEIKNSSHEGSDDSETKMLQKVAGLVYRNKLKWKTIIPIMPVAAAIYTDPRGTNARVRGNRRYGSYWPPKSDFRYYEILDYESLAKDKKMLRDKPWSIEEVVSAVGFLPPIDENGSWLKNPIRPETAQPGDWVELDYFDYSKTDPLTTSEEDKFLEEWLNS